MALRALAFGDVGSGRWGAVFSPGSQLPSFAVFGTEPTLVLEASIEGGSSPTAEWWVGGEGIELAVAPEAGCANVGDGFDQLVAVRGDFPGNGAREADLIGSRSERSDELQPGRFALVRDLRAWFSPAEGLALIAVRPRGASTHGDERLSATLFEAGEPLPVAEPRLSTSYGDDGLPARAALELWLPEVTEQGGDDEDEHTVSYPRRAAGEATGPGTMGDLGSLKVEVRPFRWRLMGRDGAGVYLLVRGA